jgi:hypothetical protein
VRRPPAPIDPVVRTGADVARAAEEHRRLKGQAANVIADQKLVELTLRRVLQHYDELTERMRRTVRAAEDAARAGDTAGGERQRAATAALAGELVALEREIDDLDGRWGAATAAADSAKERVRAHTRHLHLVVAERDRVLGGPGVGPRPRPPGSGPAPGPVPEPPPPAAPPAAVRFGAGGEIRRAELRALLGLPTGGRDAGAHPGEPSASARPGAAAVTPPAYPTGPQRPRPEQPPRRR